MPIRQQAFIFHIISHIKKTFRFSVFCCKCYFRVNKSDGDGRKIKPILAVITCCRQDIVDIVAHLSFSFCDSTKQSSESFEKTLQ